jgi:predicted dehydrogenase
MKRVGILGTGAIAQVHLEGWQRLPATISAYYDIRPEAAQRAAATYGGQACASLEEFFDRVDLVDICTPSATHKENVLAAVAAGKAIVCEKPLARHLADAEAIVAAVEVAGVRLFVAQVVRFFPQYAKAKALLDRGALGNVGVIRTVRAGSFPRMGGTFTSDFYSDFNRSGGVILDLGIHDIDFQRWCCGEVERVFARGLTFANLKECDHALITLKFANGAIGHIECSWAHPPCTWRTRLEIAGDDGIVEWDGFEDAPLLALFNNDDGTGFTQSLASPTAPEDNPYYLELKHFLECVEQDKPFVVTPRDGLMAVKLSLAAIESLRSGAPVDVDR